MTNRDKWWLFLAVGLLTLFIGTRVGQKVSHASRVTTVSAGVTPEEATFMSNMDRLLALMKESVGLMESAQSNALRHQYSIGYHAAASAMCAYSDPAPVPLPAKFASGLFTRCAGIRAEVDSLPAQDQIDIKLRAMRLLETVR
jgi:hypothetical protein